MRGFEKDCMERGQTYKHTDTQTLRLLDQLGPEGRVGEKATWFFIQILPIVTNMILKMNFLKLD